MPAPTLQQKTLDEVSATKEMVHALDKKIDALTIGMNTMNELVAKHERLLYRTNGNPGMVDEVEDLKEYVEEMETEKKERKEAIEKLVGERRRTVYALGTSIILILVDIAMHLFQVPH